jgi:hypothetical protein
MSAQRRAARMTTTSELTPEGGSAGGMPGIRLGLAGPLSLLPCRRRREYDGGDGRGIAGAGGCGGVSVKKKWSGERTEREVPCLGGWDG